MPDVLKYQCPFCDTDVRVGSPCPGCSKLERKPKLRPTQLDHSADGLDLPDESFDYDAFVAQEFGPAPHRKLGVKWYWWLLGVALLIGMVASLFRLK
jgi:hypothetical protein